MTKNFKKEILEKIKSGKIDQKSRGFFLTKSYIFGFLSGLSTILGGFTFATILLHIQENNRAFMLLPKPHHTLEGFGEALPHWWVLVFILLLITAYLNYKNTYKNYVIENIFIIIISLTISIILGFIIFFSGIAKKIDHGARGYFPVYKRHLEHRKKIVDNFLRENGYNKQNLVDPELREDIRKKIRNEINSIRVKKLK